MSPRRDPHFGRFAFTVFMFGIVIVILGLAGIWYYFQVLPNQPGTGPQGAGAGAAVKLPPTKAMLYYTKDGRALTGTIAEIGPPGTSPGDKARTIVNALLEGRDRAFLRATVPPGTKLNAVFVQDGLVIVNLSRDFLNNMRGGTDAELLAVYAIVNSLLLNLDSVNAVQILIEGQKVPTAGGDVDIEQPLIANTSLARAS